MNQLIEKWRELALNKGPFVLQDDVIDPARNFSFDTYESFVASDSFGVSSSKFHLGLIPQPYIGDLAGASIFLLFINPGFSTGDYYAQQHCDRFKTARIRNLRQTSEEDYPFFYLNPEFSWTAGGQWWQNKLRSVAEELKNKKGLSYQESLQHLSKHIACLELCPYFSKEYKSGGELSSSQLMLDYAQSEVASKCREGEAIAIVTRQAKVWNMEDGGNVLCFKPNEARGAHLTMKTAAGKRVYEKLVQLL